jgi:hypothetical protein
VRSHAAELEMRLTVLASLAVPAWRTGDRRYYDINEAAWTKLSRHTATPPRANAGILTPRASAAAAAAGDAGVHPSEVRLQIGPSADHGLSFDNSAPYGDDLVLTALLLLRKSDQLNALSMTNSGLTDRGADLISAAVRAGPGDSGGYRPPVVRLVLANNAALSAFGARRLISAVLTWPAASCVGGVLDLSGCPSIYAGAPDDVGAVEALVEQLIKVHGFTLLLPPRPETPFYVDAQPVRLSDFQSMGAEYRPLQVGQATWLHREDIKLKSEAKAEGLFRFLTEIVDEQTKARRAGPTTSTQPRPAHEAGYEYLATVRYTAIRGKLTVVAVVDAPSGKTYAQLMADAAESGLAVTRYMKLQIFLQVCAAVAFSHSHNFAMRTLRPDLLMVHLAKGVVTCKYMDYCALRPETLRSTKVQLGCRMAFTDPSVRAGQAVSRSMDSYAAAMMVVYAYAFTDVLDDFKGRQYTWLNEQQRPIADQAPDAQAHYEALGVDKDIATLVVHLTRPDDRRMSCADAAKAFSDLLQHEPAM